MSKHLRYLLLVLVLIVPLTLAACGDDDDNNGGDNGNEVNLSQSFESDSGVSLNYPEDWVAEDRDGQVILASSADALEAMDAAGSGDEAPPEGEAGIVVFALPVAEMGMPEDATVDTVFDMMVTSMTGEGMETVDETESLEIGGVDARRQNVKDSASDADGFIIAYLDADGVFVMLIGITAPGERENFDDIGLQIAESVEFSAPAAETE